MEEKEFDLQKFLENSKKIKKAKEMFHSFMNETIDLNSRIKEIVQLDQIFLIKELKKFDLETLYSPKVGRLTTFLSYMKENVLVEYKKFILEKWSLKKLDTKPVFEGVSTKEQKQKWVEDVKNWEKHKNNVDDFNLKFKTLVEFLNENIKGNLWGDSNVDVSNLPYVYFKFFNIDNDELEVFIKDIWDIPVESIKNILSVKIEDITSNLPDFVKKGSEVRFYFETKDSAYSFKESGDYLKPVYEKFLYKNNLMFKSGGEFGLWNERKDNIKTNVIKNYDETELITPTKLTDGEIKEKIDWFSKDLVFSLEDCYWCFIKESDKLIALVPKKFFDEYNGVLPNSNLEISDLDMYVFKRNGLYFSYKSDNDLDNVEDNAEFSEKMQKVLNI